MSKMCFVVGPIGNEESEERIHADWLLEGIIAPVLAKFSKFIIERADKDPRPGLIEVDARGRSHQYAFEYGLTHHQPIPPQIVAVELDKIERPHEHIGIVAAVSDAIEGGNSIGTARDGLRTQGPPSTRGSGLRLTQSGRG
jgi:hypothetical protein